MSIRERLTDIYDSFSNRNTQALSKEQQVPITQTFCNRILMFWRDYISGTLPIADPYMHDQFLDSFWSEMHQNLVHLYGQPFLSQRRSGQDTMPDLQDHLNNCQAPEFFDFMEQAFKLPVSWRLMRNSDQIIDAINEVFRVEDLPYELTRWITREEQSSGFIAPGIPASGTRIVTVAHPQVIRVDDKVPHREAVEPALAALSAPHFSQANREFVKALKHYRDGDFPDCLTACGATMESTLKVLCDRNSWRYNQTDALKALLDIVVPKTGLESFYKEALTHIGTIRNRRSSAHGRGSTAQPVPRHIAQYTITVTAAAVILLIEEADP